MRHPPGGPKSAAPLPEKTLKIAVLGSTGQTGRLLVNQALARGHEVVALAPHTP